MTVHDYFLNGRHLGRASCPPCVYPPDQVALFCATCGEVWGRVTSSDGGPWQMLAVPCAKHEPMGVPDWGTIPGSFVQRRALRRDVGSALWAVCLDSVPPKVVDLEFEAWMREALRGRGETE